MNSRQTILERVRAARPACIELPSLARVQRRRADNNDELCTQFVQIARAGGSTVVELARHDVASTVRSLYPGAREVLSTVVEVEGPAQLNADLRDMSILDLFVCEGSLGVAQDGAVYMPGVEAGQRAALFLAEHVVILLDRRRIVATLHEAYAQFDVRTRGFAVLVAGPSKTADIEQSLVIGAHGPMSLTVLLVA